MTAVASQELVDRPTRRLSGRTRLALWIAIATGVSLLMAAPAIKSVWQGGFGDPDDAMRLVQVRAWMAGQSWFDVTAMRLDPPGGAPMHWSRLVDVPNAALIEVFSVFVDQAPAEALDRIVLPTLLLAGLFAGMARLAGALLGAAAAPIAVLGTFFSGVTLVQFQPGRIGHHAPETVTLVFAVAFALESIDPARARRAGVAGLLVALALAMSFETLPLLAALCAAMILLWVVRGDARAPMLAWFAMGLGVALTLLFVATVAPTHWLAPACDAFSMAHLGAGLIFAAGAFALARGSAFLNSRAKRLTCVIALGLAALAYVGFRYPDCLRSPFAGVDPLVRTVWLDNVMESKPLFVFMQKLPMTGLAIVLPALLGSVGLMVAARSTKERASERFGVLAIMTVTGVGVGLLQVRVFTSVAPLALCGGLYVVAALHRRLAARGLGLAAILAPAAILPFASTAWAIALPADAAPGRDHRSCLSPAALAPLNSLAPGRIVAPIDLGAHILVSSPHDVFAAPYHRNNDGNRFALDVFLARPDVAKALLAARQVAYVLTCDGMGESDRLAARAPDGLAAALKAHRIPGFLTPVAMAGTPYRVFAFDPSR